MKNSYLNRILLINFFLITSLVQQSFAQRQLFKYRLDSIAQKAQGTVGIAALNFSTGDTIQFNSSQHFPMQSVMKFPLALAVLHQVDLGKLQLSQKIHIDKADLAVPAVSPIRDQYPNGNVDLSVAELLSYTVSQSDNNGCDKLFQILGGPQAVNDYIHRLGVRGIAIVATEKEMAQDWDTQYRNWCTPSAMVRLLELFERGNILSKSSHDLLWKLLVATINCPQRIKGNLPPGAIAAHKPGTSSVNSHGVAAATNDVGIVVLPDKRKIAVAFFVTNATAAMNVREQTIAGITKLICDEWSSRSY